MIWKAKHELKTVTWLTIRSAKIIQDCISRPPFSARSQTARWFEPERIRYTNIKSGNIGTSSINNGVRRKLSRSCF